MTFSAGDKLGPYEILGSIGAGGMGEVWKARDPRLDRIVAIKTSSQAFSERFEREARAIAALNHPNICQIYDVGPDYLVMEYVEGTEIKGPLPLDQALRLAIQLASALEAAHRKAITHRDLKPANVLTTKSGIKVLDFGLAKFEAARSAAAEATQTRPLTAEGTIVGTLQYMAPEQLQGKSIDARADLFSFGCVLYEMLTGKRAFRGENQATLIAAILDREPEPIAAQQPMVPPMLERVVRKCLAKDPDERWQTAADLKSELEWVLEGGSNAALAAPVAEHRRRNARLGWLAAGVLAALLAAAVFAAFHYRSGAAPAAVVRFEVRLPEGASWSQFEVPQVSPDGTRVLFAATSGADERHGLWLRRLDAIESQLIPGTEGTTVGNGGWSPDGRSIVYVTGAKLTRLDLAGGAPQTLSSMRASYATPAWGPDGTILFTGGEDPYPLYQVSASGGEPKRALAAGGGEYYPSFLPDGRHFLYLVAGSQAAAGIYAGLAGAAAGKRLAGGSSAVFAPPGWLLLVRGTTLVAQSFDPDKLAVSADLIPIAEQVAASGLNGGAFSVSRNGVLAYRRALPAPLNDLTWYDRAGQRLGTVGEKAVYTNPALSPDGKRLAVGRLDAGSTTRDIWVLDLARGVSSRFTFDQADETNPVWSPDGSRIAFSRVRKGTQNTRDLYWKAAGGASAEEALLQDDVNKALEDWSPDGKLLLFNVSSHEIDAVPVSGERKPQAVLKAAFAQDHGRVSPDGRWIAYVSVESGRREVFVQSFPPAGGKWQISSGGGTEPSWRRDGKELYFLSGSKLEAVDVKVNGAGFEAGIPKELFEVQLDAVNRRNRYVATPDGQRFLFVTTPKSVDTTPFVVVQNWQAALKR